MSFQTRFMIAFAIAVTCSTSVDSARAQNAVQWTEAEGGNGHWYARAEFANQDYEGLISYAQSLGGNLASITSAEENIFLSGISADLPDSTLLGARDEHPSPDICEWTWADGSEWNYTNWAADQPNSCGGEEYVTYYSAASESREWHDMGLNNGSIRWFLIEWSADCNDDGIVDYGQILDGTFSDDDGNGVPDPCDQPGGFDGILDVPSEYTTIQEAIDDCPEGSTVRVAAGTYFGLDDSVITLPGRSINIIGEGATTIIDGEGTRRGVVGIGCQGGGTTIDGLTFTNCRSSGGSDAEGTGAGMYFYEACITIRNCVFQSNVAELHGGGIRAYEGTIDVESCVFNANNSLAGNNLGGGIFFSDGEYTITNCLFDGNTAAYGSGVGLWNCESALLTECTLINNINAGESGASGALATVAYGANSCTVDVNDCLIADNTSVGVKNNIHGAADITLSNTQVCGNGSTQINGSFNDNGGNCIRETCDSDSDGDGLNDCEDPCPNWPGTCSEDGQTVYVQAGESIQDAIDNCPDGGVIEIAEGAFQPDSTLNPGGRAMTIRGAIDGGGNPVTILDGQDSIRLVICENGEESDTVFENLTIINGYSSDHGGAFLFQGTSPSVINCVFENCVADGGGAISCKDQSESVISDCIFIGNDGPSGGGAIYCYNSCHPTITDCYFANNTTQYDGGGIYTSFNSSADIIDCTFNTNNADRWGGGVFLSEPGVISDSNFSGNTGEDGGAVYLRSTENSGDSVISNCMFQNNSANLDGGAVYAADSVNLDLTDCIFESNTADDGGAILLVNGGTMQSCRFTGNSANADGGAVRITNCVSASFETCHFTENRTTNNSNARGGAIQIQGGDASFLLCSFTGNNMSTTDTSSNNSGGAVWMSGTNCDIQQCEFSTNSATYDGGAILATSNSQVDIEESDFIGNTAEGAGAMRIEAGSDLQATSCTFNDNSCGNNHGGVAYLWKASGLFQSCVMMNNSSDGHAGAFITYQEDVVVRDSYLIGNSADDAGNTVYVNNSSLTLSGTTVCDSEGDGWISGGYMDEGENTILTDCSFEDCNSDDIPDFVQILDGTFVDCNGNGVPDECELYESFAASEPRTSTAPADFIEFDVSAMADAADVVNLQVSVLGDYASPATFITVYLDAAPLGFAFSSGGQNCVEITAGFDIPAADWNAEGADGDRRIRISGTSLQTDLCDPDRFTAVNVTVPLAFDDCNSNGLWDACELADGSAIDTDGDGVMNQCDGCVDDPLKTEPGACGCGTPDTDTDEDGTPDCNDPCPTWPYECDKGTLVVTVDRSIQEAMDLVETNGVIAVDAGTFQPAATLDPNGRDFTLRGAIDAEGAPLTIIDGQDSLRIMNVDSGETAALVIENLIIRNGNSGSGAEDHGGGIRIYNADATITNCWFEDNIGTNYGGALVIHNDDAVSETSVISCVFTNNAAIDGVQPSGVGGRGGAIAIYRGNPTISGCLFSQNQAQDEGGAIHCNSAPPSVSLCTFENNSAADDGGAILLYQSLASITDCDFSENTAREGGAMYNRGSSEPDLADCNFIGNSATLDINAGGGGAMYNTEDSNPQLTRCHFESNTASYGGAIINSRGNPTLEDCTFTSNVADIDGGGMYSNVGSDSVLANCTFTGNEATNNGGAVHLLISSAQFSDCVFNENEAGYGAGIQGLQSDGVAINDCTFTANTATQNGGAININSFCNFTVNSCTMEQNLAGRDGGAVMAANSTIAFEDCTIRENFADQLETGVHDGGGIWEGPDTTISISSTTICGNVPDQVSGSFENPGADNCISEFCDSDSDGIFDCIDGCPDDPDKTEPGQCGCGFPETDTDEDGIADCDDPCPNWPYDCSDDGETLFVSAGQSIQEAIDTVPDGGSIRVLEGTYSEAITSLGRSYTLRGDLGPAGELLVTIDAMQASAVIVCDAGDESVFENLRITGGSNADGAGIRTDFCSPSFINCLIEENTATGRGGGVFVRAGSPTFSRCVIRYNTAQQAGGGFATYGLDGSTEPTVIDTAIYGNVSDQIVNTEGGDWQDGGGNCIVSELGADLDGNLIPDECDPDCNANGIPDSLDVDCDADGIPDDCAIEDGLVEDCNLNGVPDECDIANGTEQDANTNGVPDTCDLLLGDLNLDGCIDGGDLGLLVAFWGFNNPPIGDLNQDGFIDGADLGLVLFYWAPCP